MEQYEKPQNLVLRRFRESDGEAVAALVAKTLWTSNLADYGEAEIERLVGRMDAAYIRERASWTHFYVAFLGDRLVGSGAIGPFHGSEVESCLFTVFVAPDLQGIGIGSEILKTLEKDEYFLRASRVEVPASVTAIPFYQRFGYEDPSGVRELDAHGLCHLQKHRKQ